MPSTMPGTKLVLNNHCTNKWSQSSILILTIHQGHFASIQAIPRPFQSRVITISFELRQLAGSVTWQLLTIPVLMTYIDNFSRIFMNQDCILYFILLLFSYSFVIQQTFNKYLLFHNCHVPK